MIRDRSSIVCRDCGESEVTHIDHTNVVGLAVASGWERQRNHNEFHTWKCPVCIAADRAEADQALAVVQVRPVSHQTPHALAQDVPSKATQE